MKKGYIKRTPAKDEKTGRFKGGYDYEVYEMPIEISESGEINRVTENPESGKTEIGEIPIPENPKLLNNEFKLNNNIYSLVIEKLNNLANTFQSGKELNMKNILDLKLYLELSLKII